MPCRPRNSGRPPFFGSVFAIAAALLHAVGARAQDADTLSRDDVFQVQFHLNQLGFDAGRPDGVAGPVTKSAVRAFARSEAADPALSEELLSRLRKAAAGIEGYRHEDGAIDLLVFTDEGTPLILSVLNHGRIFKTPSKRYVREHDRDGTPIKSSRFTVSHIGPADAIPYAPNVTFGYEVRVPAPPAGERLQIDHAVQWPLRQADGTVRYRDGYVSEHIYLRTPNFNPRYWTWTMGDPVTPEQVDYYSGVWKVEIRNRGRPLIVRDFVVGGDAPPARQPVP